MHVMLGCPAFVVFGTVGSVEAIAQMHAFMEVWGLRKLEVSLLLFRKRNIRNANFEKSQSTISPRLQLERPRVPEPLERSSWFQAQVCGGMIAVRGMINR
ncbi:hypothetical protein FPQ18DRAFT_314195 [Pyronema domesticum]|nr:hypothetical protein FPQ18DRAFT_314195 [Pyronema domesticum]